MQTHLRGRDVIDFQEWTKDEIDTVLDVAFALKRDRALGRPHPYLRDKVLAMLFFFASTRTRASFEAGMAQLGGHAQFIESRSTQITHGDTAKEMRKADRAKVEKLFITTPAAQTLAPNLQKESAAKNVEAFFDKLAEASITDAQRRFPELLKVAQQPTPDLKPKPVTPGKGPIPVRDGLTGGNS